VPPPVLVHIYVEPDTLSAWIGVAGVAVGVALTAGMQMARHWLEGREGKRRSLTQAADTLLGGCNSLAVLVGVRRAPNFPPDQLLAWTKECNREAERVQAAAHFIQRHARPELWAASARLADAAFAVIGSDDRQQALTEMSDAMGTFYQASTRGDLRASPVLGFLKRQ
jgi:hypothetical protein